MPQQSFVVSPGGPWQLALVGPGVNPGAATTTVLGTAMQRLWLTADGMRFPHATLFSQGQVIGRVNDAGEATVTFPNTDLWRNAFKQVSIGTDATYGRLYWLEVYSDGDFVEQTIAIVKVEPDRQGLVVSGFTGSFSLKSQFEIDFQCLMAPRDAWERFTKVMVPTTADNFQGGVLDTSKWTQDLQGGTATTTVAFPSGGGCRLTCVDATGTANFGLKSNAQLITTAYQPWRVDCQIVVNQLDSQGVGIRVDGSGGTNNIALWFTNVDDRVNSPTIQYSRPSTASKGGVRALSLRSDGRWVGAWIDGMLIGYVPAFSDTGATVRPFVQSTGGGTAQATFMLAVGRSLQPFLMRGADKGDVVLPGSYAASAGGLHGRFYNDADLASDASRLFKVLAPDRDQGNPGMYAEQISAAGSTTTNPAGAPPTNWSAKFFGSVYLVAGTYTFTTRCNSGAMRLWVGKVDNNPGSAIVSDWTFGGGRSTNGSFTAAQAGWYPILFEYACDSGVAGAGLSFTPPSSYTDPGGTAITGSSSTAIPATSLAPLGCYDKRLQRQSFFDAIQTDLEKGFGLNWVDVPQTLESGAFPCVTAPHATVGRVTDEVIEWDDIDRRSGALNIKSTTDSTDMVSSLNGQGAGTANGSGGQPTAEVVDVTTLEQTLFDMQGQSDHTDVGQTALLAALLNDELGLRLTPWQTLDGDVLGRNRLADSFPLTGTLAAFRWQPGDSARVWLPELMITDTAPRQFLQTTKTFTPEGRTGTTIGFRAYPRTAARTLRQFVSSALRQGRNRQRTPTTLSGSYVNQTLAAGATSTPSLVALSAGDQVIKAVAIVNQNSAGQPLDLLINGTDQTTNLNGPWSLAPVPIDITRYATDSRGITNAFQLYAAVKNAGASSTVIDLQILVTVLR